MYWDKKDFFNINKMRFDEYDKEELFYWFCKNHPKDAPDSLKTSINKINKNILNNEQIFNIFMIMETLIKLLILTLKLFL